MGCLMGQDGTVGLAWLPLPWNIIEVMVNTAWFMMVHICPNINANLKNFIILVLFYGVCVYIIYMCVIMYSMIIWSLLFCLIPTIESRKTTDMFVALRRWPLRSAPIFFLDHRMGLFFAEGMGLVIMLCFSIFKISLPLQNHCHLGYWKNCEMLRTWWPPVDVSPPVMEKPGKLGNPRCRRISGCQFDELLWIPGAALKMAAGGFDLLQWFSAWCVSSPSDSSGLCHAKARSFPSLAVPGKEMFRCFCVFFVSALI